MMTIARNPTAAPRCGCSVLMNSIKDGGYDSPSAPSEFDTTDLTRTVVVGFLTAASLMTLTWGFFATVRL